MTMPENAITKPLLPWMIAAALLLAAPMAAQAQDASAADAEVPAESERAEEPMALADLIEQVESAVVRISTDRGIGSGFLADGRGLVVTNFHVVFRARRATVVFANGRSLEVAGWAAVSPEKDLAVLRVRSDEPLPTIPLRAELPRKGESVVAFGAPLGLDFTVSQGIISALRTSESLRKVIPGMFGPSAFDPDTQWIQTTTPISPGNSGGPLVDEQGRVVGVNTASRSDGQNLNFAVASTEVASLLSKVSDTFLPLPVEGRPGVEAFEPPAVPSAYEEFDYAPGGADLLGQTGAEGFDDAAWFPAGFNAPTYANFKIAEGSLTFSSLATAGNRVRTEATPRIAGLGRRLAAPIRADLTTTLYLSFLVRPEDDGGGFLNGFFGVYLDGPGSADLFIGAGGSPRTYRLETRGGSGRACSGVSPVAGETALLVVRADLQPGRDVFTLYVNPEPGEPEPIAGSVKEDLDIGSFQTLVIYSTGAFSLDELRIGATYDQVTPTAAEAPSGPDKARAAEESTP
jgi:S1-C subfamily serine protease